MAILHKQLDIKLELLLVEDFWLSSLIISHGKLFSAFFSLVYFSAACVVRYAIPEHKTLTGEFIFQEKSCDNDYHILEEKTRTVDEINNHPEGIVLCKYHILKQISNTWIIKHFDNVFKVDGTLWVISYVIVYKLGMYAYSVCVLYLYMVISGMYSDSLDLLLNIGGRNYFIFQSIKTVVIVFWKIIFFFRKWCHCNIMCVCTTERLLFYLDNSDFCIFFVFVYNLNLVSCF